jgi:lipopolysaccharide transport system ATP-binding protein
MSAPAIEVSGLSKRYVIEHESRQDSLRDTLHHKARKLWRRYRWGTGFETEEFWALRDVSFTVQPGEVVGIIGRNGAGKSTLLKILSRITEPTSGKVTLRGRVASLLEVGTGFHPDLTGRENIFLNGAILGMQRAEIRRKFDEIVAFAEIERFLDTPVKRYSSGMYVRLAFAVAAHLEPEILILDEVLAVGDASFQTKCLGKMESVSRSEGRTVLFVSHNTGTIAKLCSRVVLMSQGRVAYQGAADAAIAQYLQQGNTREGQGTDLNLRASAHPVTLRSAEILDADGRLQTQLANHQAFRVRLTFEMHAEMPALRIGFRLQTADGTVVLSTTDCDGRASPSMPRAKGLHVSEVEFPAHLLNVGHYYLWVGFDIPMVAGVLAADRAASFSIEGTGGLATVNDRRMGVVAPHLPWTVRPPAR